MVFIFNLKIISSAAGHMKMKKPMPYPIHSICLNNILPSECVQWLALPPFWVALRWHPPSRRPPHQMMSPKCGTFQQQQQWRCGWGRKWEIMIGASVFEIFQSKPMCLWNDISPTHVISMGHVICWPWQIFICIWNCCWLQKKIVEGSPPSASSSLNMKGKKWKKLLN